MHLFVYLILRGRVFFSFIVKLYFILNHFIEKVYEYLGCKVPLP